MTNEQGANTGAGGIWLRFSCDDIRALQRHLLALHGANRLAADCASRGGRFGDALRWERECEVLERILCVVGEQVLEQTP